MTDLVAAQKAIDERITSQFASVANVRTNQDADALFNVNPPAAFIHFKLTWGSVRQMDLGNPDAYRGEGILSAVIYAPKDQGPAKRNEYVQKVVDAFRSQKFGGVECSAEVQVLPDRELKVWNITGVQVPFWFDKR